MARYRRPQMEAALWGVFSARLADDPRGHSAPSVFLGRIKRLLDLDAKASAGIFAVEPVGGSGNAAAYDPFGVFLMALGLVLLDAGFKQSDAIYILRHIKEELRPQYDKIASNPFDLHQQLARSDRPEFPHLPDNAVVSDQSVFMVLAKVEMRECWSGNNLPDPFIIGPTFCYGLTELQRETADINWQRPSRFIIEIAGLTQLTRNHLFRNELSDLWEKHTGKAISRHKTGTSVAAAALKKPAKSF